MEFVYKSKVIDDPEVNLVNDLRDTVLNLESTDDTRDYVIKMGTLLFDILEREMCPERDDLPVMIKGIVCIEDNGDDNITEDFVYCIYRKEEVNRMDRLCTECGVDIEESEYNQVALQKPDHTGDLCKMCWDREWEKCKSQASKLTPLRKNEPVLALTPVKTLNGWFANLPLIQKREHYDSHIKIIAENLK